MATAGEIVLILGCHSLGAPVLQPKTDQLCRVHVWVLGRSGSHFPRLYLDEEANSLLFTNARTSPTRKGPQSRFGRPRDKSSKSACSFFFGEVLPFSAAAPTHAILSREYIANLLLNSNCRTQLNRQLINEALLNLRRSLSFSHAACKILFLSRRVRPFSCKCQVSSRDLFD